MKLDTPPKAIQLDERNHVEKPLLDQLASLGWQILDLEMRQKPSDSHRETFAQVAILPILRQQLQTLNPWLQSDQSEEVIAKLTASFPSTTLLENNRHLFKLLQENTSVSENRTTQEKSPTVKLIDFDRPTNNHFLAICQFKASPSNPLTISPNSKPFCAATPPISLWA